MQPRRKDSGWVALAWLLNIAGLGGILLVLITYRAFKPVQAEQSKSKVIWSVPGSLPAYPTLYYLPTVTPNPRSTMIVVESPTPFVLANGMRPGVIGFSVSGRPIEVYTFGQGEKQRMIVAGIHGGYEWNTIALADQLITHIASHPEIIPSDVTLYIIRNLNPDGDARDHGIEGRVNDHGVDLNRNFPENWRKEWNRDGCWDYGPSSGGPAPASEPETRVMVSFLNSHKVEVLISYHSAALGIFPGGDPWDKDSVQFAKTLHKVSTYPFPPIDTGCKFSGALADYAVKLGAAAVDMELTDHRNTDFNMNLKVLNVLLHWEP
jgi:predicted deacylase